MLTPWELQAEGGGFELKDYTEEAKKEEKEKQEMRKRTALYKNFILLWFHFTFIKISTFSFY